MRRTSFWKISLMATRGMFASFFLGAMIFGIPWFVFFLVVLFALGAAATQSPWMLIPPSLAGAGIAGMLVRGGYRVLQPLGRRAWMGGLVSMLAGVPFFLFYVLLESFTRQDAADFRDDMVRNPRLVLGVAAFILVLGFFTFLGGCVAAFQASRRMSRP